MRLFNNFYNSIFFRKIVSVIYLYLVATPQKGSHIENYELCSQYNRQGTEVYSPSFLLSLFSLEGKKKGFFRTVKQ